MCLCVSMVMHEKERQPSSHPPLALHSPHLCINRSLFSHAPPPLTYFHMRTECGGKWFQCCGAAARCMAPSLQTGSPDQEQGVPRGTWLGKRVRGAHVRAHHWRGGTQGTQPEGEHTGDTTGGGAHGAHDWRGGTWGLWLEGGHTVRTWPGGRPMFAFSIDLETSIVYVIYIS